MYLNVNTKLITFGHDMSTLVDSTRCVTAWDRFRLNIFKTLFINRLHVYSLPAEMTTGAKHREEGPGAGRDHRKQMAQFESRLLREALERNDWNQTRTAAELRLSRQGLIMKLQRYGLGKAGRRSSGRLTQRWW